MQDAYLAVVVMLLFGGGIGLLVAIVRERTKVRKQWGGRGWRTRPPIWARRGLPISRSNQNRTAKKGFFSLCLNVNVRSAEASWGWRCVQVERSPEPPVQRRLYPLAGDVV